MPTLHWIGKEKVQNHHLEVPMRVLNHEYHFEAETPETVGGGGHKIIHGDNLEALKALLPEYEGRVKCIYIDPPYNTGNEGWVYNDNVNDPKLKKWLKQVVGKEGDDLSRHDKWLCMMYPRLKLLHKLLANDGLIFISIDNFEFNYLSLLLEEIFGRINCIENIIWKKSYGGGAKSKHVVNLHEYIYFYAKDISKIQELALSHDDSILKYYKFKDEKFDLRGPYRLQPLATTSMDARPNLRYPIQFKGEEIWPQKQWQWSKERVQKALTENDLVIENRKGKWSVNYKQYLKSEDGQTRGKKLYSIVEEIYTQKGTMNLREVLPDNSFTFPKPVQLIETLIELVSEKDSIILDSFAGSGTTLHAVLNLNQADGGNRQCILVEMEDYAETITAERVRRVMNGYGEKGGTGGSFDYFTLGERIFNEEDELNENIPLEAIRQYIWYTETATALPQPNANRKTGLEPASYLGIHNETAYYFHWHPGKATTLNLGWLKNLVAGVQQHLVYSDNCTLNKQQLGKYGVIFKKIPRDVRR